MRLDQIDETKGRRAIRPCPGFRLVAEGLDASVAAVARLAKLSQSAGARQGEADQAELPRLRHV